MGGSVGRKMCACYSCVHEVPSARGVFCVVLVDVSIVSWSHLAQALVDEYTGLRKIPFCDRNFERLLDAVCSGPTTNGEASAVEGVATIQMPPNLAGPCCRNHHASPCFDPCA